MNSLLTCNHDADIAKRLGTKIYVNERKKRIIACLENKELEDLLTDDPREAQVHALPIMHLKKKVRYHGDPYSCSLCVDVSLFRIWKTI